MGDDTMEQPHFSVLAMRWAHGVGVAIEEALRAAGLEPDRFERGTPLTVTETRLLWDALAELTRDPHVGLHAGERLQIDQLGPVGPAFATAADLGRGIEALVRTVGAFMSKNAPTLEKDADGYALLYRTPLGGSPHGAEAILAGFLTLARTCTNAAVIPRSVTLARPAPRDVREHTRVFGIQPTWGGASARLVFAREDLARPLRGANPALSRLLVEHAPDFVAVANPRSGSSRSVLEEALLDATALGEGTLDGVAARLGVSPRSVQRRLASRGERFRELKARLLRERALELIDDGTPVREIAKRLGYANRASFERAFKRWTGETPASLRQGRERD